MPYREPEKDKDWRKKNTRFFGLVLSRISEPELIEWLEKQPSMQGAIKDLIRLQIEREKTR
jgi:hypothetical protein